MSNLEHALWLGSSDTRDFFEGFPYPLVLMQRDGKLIAANRVFMGSCGKAGLEGADIRQLALSPGAGWQQVAMSLPDGNIISMRAQALAVGEDALIVFAPQSQDGASGEVADLRRRLSQLERLVATDRLTGCWNRAHLDRMIELELSRSNRYQQPLSLLMLDIDHFKLINDRHGHQSGDLVLQELVRVVQLQIRKADLLFRWGGEEFIVMTPATGYRSAANVAEKIRMAVANQSFPAVGSVTVSIGVAEHLPDEDAPDLFRRVDAALYAAKNSGRNRIVVDRQGGSDEWARIGIAPVIRLEWSEAYECGDNTIDGQHRRLFDLANRLIETAFAPNPAGPALQSALEDLLSHVVRHFSDEEAILQRLHYANLDAHKRAHASLLARAAQLRASADSGMITLGEVVEFLANDVVARHLLRADRDFFPLLQAASDARSVG